MNYEIELEVEEPTYDLNATESFNTRVALTEGVKQALLQMAEYVAYIDEHGRDYYQDLYDALYPPIGLNSISAFFQPGSTVIYDSMSLDDLKQYLTVTALYSDGTIESLKSTDYTLSGSMEAGQQTITVRYGGETTGFIVTVVEWLVSIDAVFTQGQNVIYTHDNLETLRQYLVVTATYDDNSTANVPSADYMLSGTLTAGTSTITVAYRGKTDTFSVVVHAGLPSAYTKYDYIVTPTQHNNTPKASWIELAKYQDLNALSCEFEVKPNLTLSQAACLGRRSASGYSSSFGFYAKGESLGWHLHGTEANVEPSTILGAVNVVKYTNTSESPSSLQTNDNAPISVVWTNNNVLNLAPVIFSNPINDSDSNMCRETELGYVKFFNLSGDLIGHYIPVVRSSDNQIGMFDLIEQVFHTTATASYSTIGNANCYYAVGNWS